MSELLLRLTPELLARLSAVATQRGETLEACALQGLADFVENWEDFGRTVEMLENGEEERTVLRAVNE